MKSPLLPSLGSPGGPSDPSPTSCCVQLLLAWLVLGKPQVASLLPENQPPRCPPPSAWEVGIFGGCYGQKGSCFRTQVSRSTAEIEYGCPLPSWRHQGFFPGFKGTPRLCLEKPFIKYFNQYLENSIRLLHPQINCCKKCQV